MANIFGTNFNDTLIGTGAADSILGFDGNDLLEGQLGSDTIDGGNGQDTVSYFDNAGVTVRLDQGFAIDAGGSVDTLIGIEDVNGSNANDIIVGTSGRNIIQGLGGNDFIEGRNGFINGDIINGGQGDDTISYVAFNVGVVVNLELDTGRVGTTSDQLLSIENAEGGQGNDTLIGDTAGNLLRGLAGNDTLEGGLGGDLLEGGTGIDAAEYRFDSVGVLVDIRSSIYQFGEAAGDVLIDIENVFGGRGNDSIGGTEGNNTLFGGEGGDDRLFGYGGNDVLGGGSFGADSIEGGGGNDTIAGGDGNDVLSGDNGIFLFDAPTASDSGADSIDGGEGNDTILGGFGADTILGGGGFDLLDYGRATANLVVDLRGNVFLGPQALGDVVSGVEAVAGGGGNDNLGGTDAGNVLDGNAGSDYVSGYGANDTIGGGSGDDGLEGGLGADSIVGGDGNDLVSDGEGIRIGSFYDAASADTLRGGNGNDILWSGGGGDVIDGGAGIDSLVMGFTGAPAIAFTVNVGTWTITRGGVTTATVTGIERIELTAGSGNDTLNASASASPVVLDGGDGIDRITGSGGADFLIGSGGNDRLNGGGGNDTLIGGAGRDSMNGGGGADTFRWDVAAEGRDTIVGFASGPDSLQIDASGFGGGLVAGENFAITGRLVFGTTATAATGQFLYDIATGDLFWDTNGTASGGGSLLVNLGAGTALATGDFIVVA